MWGKVLDWRHLLAVQLEREDQGWDLPDGRAAGGESHPLQDPGQEDSPRQSHRLPGQSPPSVLSHQV